MAQLARARRHNNGTIEMSQRDYQAAGRTRPPRIRRAPLSALSEHRSRRTAGRRRCVALLDPRPLARRAPASIRRSRRARSPGRAAEPAFRLRGALRGRVINVAAGAHLPGVRSRRGGGARADDFSGLAPSTASDSTAAGRATTAARDPGGVSRRRNASTTTQQTSVSPPGAPGEPQTIPIASKSTQRRRRSHLPAIL